MIDLLAVIYALIEPPQRFSLINDPNYKEAKKILEGFKDKSLADKYEKPYVLTYFKDVKDNPIVITTGYPETEKKGGAGLRHIDQWFHLDRIADFCKLIGKEPTTKDVLSLIYDWMTTGTYLPPKQEPHKITCKYQKAFTCNYKDYSLNTDVRLYCGQMPNHYVITLFIPDADLLKVGLEPEPPRPFTRK